MHKHLYTFACTFPQAVRIDYLWQVRQFYMHNEFF